MTGRAMLAAALWALALAGCRGGNPEVGVPERVRVAGGRPREGVIAAQRYNCGVCHAIPGVDGANSFAAPPLLAFSRRTFIAGVVPNTAENLVAWLEQPRAIQPRTAMPAVGLSDQDARDIAAYLYTLR